MVTDLTDKEAVALLEMWWDAAVQAELKGDYRNDHIYRKIASGFHQIHKSSATYENIRYKIGLAQCPDRMMHF